MTRSEASIGREKKRNSLKTAAFRDSIDKILVTADPEIAYRMRQDLKLKTDMPFYGHKFMRIKRSRSNRDVIKAYAELLMRNNDGEFSRKLLSSLNQHQKQTIRMMAPRIEKVGKRIWDHVIPAGYIVDEIIKMINSGSIGEIDKLLDIYEEAGQRAITKEQDKKLKPYVKRMPEGWDWRKPDANCLARYAAVGLEIR